MKSILILILFSSWAMAEAPSSPRAELSSLNQGNIEIEDIKTPVKSMKHKHRLNFYKDEKNDSKKADKKIKKFLKKIKHILFHDHKGKKKKQDFELREIENDNVNLLTIELDSKDFHHNQEKYIPHSIKYKIYLDKQRILKEYTKDLYEVEGHMRFDVNIADLELGDYKLALQIFSEKAKHDHHKKGKKGKGRGHKHEKKKKDHISYASIDFTKEYYESATAVLDLVSALPGNYRVTYSMANSSSGLGAITEYTVRLYRGSELLDEFTQDPSIATEFSYSFDTLGDYQIELEVSDGTDSDTTRTETITPDKLAPKLEFNLSQNQNYPDIFSIDFTGSTAPTGAVISGYLIRVYQNGQIIEQKFSNQPIFDFQTNARGEFSILALVLSSDGTNNFELKGPFNLAPDFDSSIFLNYSHRFFDETNPRRMYLAFTNQVSQEDFKQWNVTVTNLASGASSSYASTPYLFDDFILHALVGIVNPGEYKFEVELELQDGRKSAPYITTQNFDFDLGAAILNVEINKVDGVRTWNINPENSNPGNYGFFTEANCELSHPNQTLRFSLLGGAFDVGLSHVGTWNVSCFARTNLNLTASYNTTIEVENVLPVAESLTLTKLSMNNREYEFNLESSDVDGYVIRSIVEITSPTGIVEVIESSEHFMYEFQSPGLYYISFLVQDNDGDWSSSIFKTLEIINEVPNIDFSFTENNLRNYTFSPSFSDIDGSVVESNFEFSSPSGEIFFKSSVYSDFTYDLAQSGEWSVLYKVTDNDGASNSIEKKVIVEAYFPSAIIVESKLAPIVGEFVSFSADQSSNPDGGALSFEWQIEGNVFSGSRLDYQFNNPVNTNVTLKVTNSDGKEDTATLTIYVLPEYSSNKRIEISASGDVNSDGSFNGEVNFDLHNSDIENRKFKTVKWTFQDGYVTEGTFISRKFSEVGLQKIVVEVTASDNEKLVSTKEIEIRNINSKDEILSDVKIEIRGIDEENNNPAENIVIIEIVGEGNFGENFEVSLDEILLTNFQKISNTEISGTVLSKDGINTFSFKGVDEEGYRIEKDISFVTGSMNVSAQILDEFGFPLSNFQTKIVLDEDFQYESLSDFSGNIKYENLIQDSYVIQGISDNGEYFIDTVVSKGRDDLIVYAQKIAEVRTANIKLFNSLDGWVFDENYVKLAEVDGVNVIQAIVPEGESTTFSHTFKSETNSRFIFNTQQFNFLGDTHIVKVSLVNHNSGEMNVKTINFEDNLIEQTGNVFSQIDDVLTYKVEIISSITSNSNSVVKYINDIFSAYAANPLSVITYPFTEDDYYYSITLLDLNSAIKSEDTIVKEYHLSPLIFLSVGDYPSGQNDIYARIRFKNGNANTNVSLNRVEIRQGGSSVSQGNLAISPFFSSLSPSQFLEYDSRGDDNKYFEKTSNKETFVPFFSILNGNGLNLESDVFVTPYLNINGVIVSAPAIRIPKDRLLADHMIRSEDKHYCHDTPSSKKANCDNTGIPDFGDDWSQKKTIETLSELLDEDELSIKVGDVSNINGNFKNPGSANLLAKRSYFSPHFGHHNGLEFDMISENFNRNNQKFGSGAALELSEVIDSSPLFKRNIQLIGVLKEKVDAIEKLYSNFCVSGLKLSSIITDYSGHFDHYHFSLGNEEEKNIFYSGEQPDKFIFGLDLNIEPNIETDEENNEIIYTYTVPSDHNFLFQVYSVSDTKRFSQNLAIYKDDEADIIYSDPLDFKVEWKKSLANVVKVIVKKNSELFFTNDRILRLSVTKGDEPSLCYAKKLELNNLDDCNLDGEKGDLAYISPDGGIIQEGINVEEDLNNIKISNGARICGSTKITASTGIIQGGGILIENTDIGDGCGAIYIGDIEEESTYRSNIKIKDSTLCKQSISYDPDSEREGIMPNLLISNSAISTYDLEKGVFAHVFDTQDKSKDYVFEIVNSTINTVGGSINSSRISDTTISGAKNILLEGVNFENSTHTNGWGIYSTSTVKDSTILNDVDVFYSDISNSSITAPTTQKTVGFLDRLTMVIAGAEIKNESNISGYAIIGQYDQDDPLKRKVVDNSTIMGGEPFLNDSDGITYYMFNFGEIVQAEVEDYVSNFGEISVNARVKGKVFNFGKISELDTEVIASSINDDFKINNSGDILGGSKISGKVINNGEIKGNSIVSGSVINYGIIAGNATVSGMVSNFGEISFESNVYDNVENYGLITSEQNTEGLFDFTSVVSGDVTNLGAIVNSRVSEMVYITTNGRIVNNSTVRGSVSNSGTIDDSEVDGGVFNGGAISEKARVSGEVKNNGSIKGEGTFVDGNVKNDGLIELGSSVDGWVSNYGLIQNSDVFSGVELRKVTNNGQIVDSEVRGYVNISSTGSVKDGGRVIASSTNNPDANMGAQINGDYSISQSFGYSIVNGFCTLPLNDEQCDNNVRKSLIEPNE